MPVLAEDQRALNREAAERVHAYARDVLDGRIVTGELVRLACQRHLDDMATAEDRGLRFDAEAAGFGIRFFPQLLRHYKGEWGPKGLPGSAGYRPGRPIELLPWEAFLVGSLDGWYMRNPEPDHDVEWIRRFTTAFVELGKKGGKSLLGAGIGLRRTFFDNEPGAEGYCIATKRDQARIVWRDADAMTAASPILRSHISRGARTLSEAATNSKFAPLSAEERGEEGINPYIAIVDELHRAANGDMLGMIENSFGARLAGLLLIITTAGEPGENVWATQRKLAEAILRGIVRNDRFFALVYAIDERDDPFDESCWPKANPSMPVTPKLEDLRQRATDAKAAPAKLNDFLRLRLNRPSSRTSRYFDMAVWQDERNAGQPAPAEGARAWGGMDLGWSRDLSAFALWVPRGERFDLVVRAWAPEMAAQRRGDGLYERFADAGWLTLTEGDVRDDDRIEAEIIELCDPYDVVSIDYDRAMASGLVIRLERSGLTLRPVGQGWLSLSPAMKELERLVTTRLLNHGGNGLLAWAASNTDAKLDDYGNVRPIKPHSTSNDKVDPISASLDAIAGWLVDRSAPAAPTVKPWVIVR
jgi:phage terminase large subunit-like protein